MIPIRPRSNDAHGASPPVSSKSAQMLLQRAREILRYLSVLEFGVETVMPYSVHITPWSIL